MKIEIIIATKKFGIWHLNNQLNLFIVVSFFKSLISYNFLQISLKKFIFTHKVFYFD